MEALDLNLKLNNLSGIAVTKNNLAWLAFQQGEFEKAVSYNIENEKIANRVFVNTPYIINHGNNLTNLNTGDCYLPILKGDFNICDSSFKTVKLFFDINIVAKTNLNK